MHPTSQKWNEEVLKKKKTVERKRLTLSLLLWTVTVKCTYGRHDVSLHGLSTAVWPSWFWKLLMKLKCLRWLQKQNTQALTSPVKWEVRNKLDQPGLVHRADWAEFKGRRQTEGNGRDSQQEQYGNTESEAGSDSQRFWDRKKSGFSDQMWGRRSRLQQSPWHLSEQVYFNTDLSGQNQKWRSELSWFPFFFVVLFFWDILVLIEEAPTERTKPNKAQMLPTPDGLKTVKLRHWRSTSDLHLWVSGPILL